MSTSKTYAEYLARFVGKAVRIELLSGRTVDVTLKSVEVDYVVLAEGGREVARPLHAIVVLGALRPSQRGLPHDLVP